MGTVFQAKDLNCRRTVAMKVLSKDTTFQVEDLLRFIEEAQITSQLEHPNIVPVHELGIDAEGNVYYTMKYVRGVTLTEVLQFGITDSAHFRVGRHGRWVGAVRPAFAWDTQRLDAPRPAAD